MSGEHARLPPSSAHMWGWCTGWLQANEGRTGVESDEARVGTATHWLGEQVLRQWGGAAPVGTRVTLCGDYLGQSAPNGVVIDEGMVEGAEVWVADVLEVCQKHGALRAIEVEKRVAMPGIHPENWGTLDTCVWLPAAKILYIWDYKHGHRQVDPFENDQLMDYCAGVVQELGIHDEGDVDVVLRIVQPNCYTASGPVREWRTTICELYPHWTRLRVAAAESFRDPKLSSGKHCRDCRAIADCPAARKTVYSVIQYVGEPPAMESMTAQAMATERDILARGTAILKARAEAIDAELTARIEAGDTSTGLGLQAGYGRQVWKVPHGQVVALAGQFGVDANKPATLTPAQVVNKVPAAMRPAFKEMIQELTDRPRTGVKLIEAGEKRTAHAFKKGE